MLIRGQVQNATGAVTVVAVPMVCSLKTSLRCGGRARGRCPEGWAFGGAEGRSLPRSGGRSNQRAVAAFPATDERGGGESRGCGQTRQHAQGMPVNRRIQTCRICRVARAFDPSGAHVNSPESDSAVRCKHGEIEISCAQESSLLLRRGIGRSRRAHQAAAGDGSWPGLAAQLLITPTLEQLGGGLASRCNTGPA